MTTLSLSVSSPRSSGRKTTNGMDIPGLVVPIELQNDCSEEGITIQSDDVALTNAVRKHYLEHFGHRDLNGVVLGYSPDAILIVQEDGKEGRTKYHGHDEIRTYYQNVIFRAHPAGDSNFHLEQITVEKKHATAVWQAKTPTMVITEGADTFVFNGNGKIVKQFFTCDAHPREDPGTSRVIRRQGSKECGEFFE